MTLAQLLLPIYFYTVGKGTNIFDLNFDYDC